MRAKQIKVGDLSGMRFGRLTVVSQAKSISGGGRRWRCVCTCGNERLVGSHGLIYGESRSCGCFQREDAKQKRTVHGLTGTPTRTSYSRMKRRCYEPGDNSYFYYGARGVKVCERWKHSFANFLEDMGPCPEGMSLDRIDNSGDYEPSNCRWATPTEQNRNKRKYRTASLRDQDGNRIPIDAETLQEIYALLAKSKPKGKAA